MRWRFIISALIIASALASCVAGDVDYSNETANITFEGVDFTIPEGFGQSRESEDFDDLGSEGKTCFYINEAKGEIVITVISDWMGMSLDELYQDGASKLTINGHDGWHYKKNNLTYFGYVEDNTGIIVGVTNQTRLKEVII